MHLPNGSQIFIAKTMGAAAKAGKASNAATPVITYTDAPSADLKAGGYALISASSWPKVEGRMVKIDKVDGTAKTVTISGVDTTDTKVFPANGTITLTPVKDWIEIPCVQDISQDGGEQQYYTYQCLSDDQEQQLPTFKSAVSLTYNFAHEFDNPIYPILRQYDENGDVVPFRMYIPRAKEMRLWAGNVSFNEIPQTQVNEMETVSVSVSLKGRFTFVKA